MAEIIIACLVTGIISFLAGGIYVCFTTPVVRPNTMSNIGHERHAKDDPLYLCSKCFPRGYPFL